MTTGVVHDDEDEEVQDARHKKATPAPDIAATDRRGGNRGGARKRRRGGANEEARRRHGGGEEPPEEQDSAASPSLSVDGFGVPEIHNVVATIQIECEPIDIQRLSAVLPFSSYDKSKFAAITLRFLNPTCTCLLFTSGKLVVTGASTWEEALLTAYYVCDLLAELHPGQGFRVVVYDVQNIVAHVELPAHDGRKPGLDLDAFYRDHFEESTYQRSMFPGLIYRPVGVPVVLLCFSSARIVITGGKSVDEIMDGWERLRPVVARYVRA